MEKKEKDNRKTDRERKSMDRRDKVYCMSEEQRQRRKRRKKIKDRKGGGREE